jgi:hypothetical protein
VPTSSQKPSACGSACIPDQPSQQPRPWPMCVRPSTLWSPELTRRSEHRATPTASEGIPPPGAVWRRFRSIRKY